MSSTLARTLALGAFALAAGCTSPLHLTYDHGRAFTDAFTAQPDLTRPSIASSTYQLYGTEAAEIRIRVREETTNQETKQSELNQTQ
jgi:hypothetical protein